MKTITKQKADKAEPVKKPLAKKPNKKSTPKKVSSTVKDNGTSDDDFNVLLEGKASKLSPKAAGHITFQVVKDKKGVISIKLLSNSSCGNFSKEPIPLKSIVELLEKQSVRAFKSSIMKDMFVGKGSQSANNTSFLIAVLRADEIALIVPSEKSQFLSIVAEDLKAKAKALLKL